MHTLKRLAEISNVVWWLDKDAPRIRTDVAAELKAAIVAANAVLEKAQQLKALSAQSAVESVK